MRRSDVGRLGEEDAAAYLLESGCRILERNFRMCAGEVDLIAEEGSTILFVEVKTRTGLQRGLPREAVDRRKQRAMTRTAFAYLALHDEERSCRFDVIEVIYPGGGAREIRHLRDAFVPDERDLAW